MKYLDKNEFFNIYIVEDDEWYANLLFYKLSQNPDNKVTVFKNAKSFLDKLHLKPDFITIDYTLPDMRGDALYKRIREKNDDVLVTVISAQEDIEVAVNLLHNGVYDYLVKDDKTTERLWASLIRAKTHLKMKHEITDLRAQVADKFSVENNILGNSSKIRETLNLIEKASKTNINVVITGETGTGKEIVARAVHYSSPLREKPFVAINVAAIPSELLESELFGHEKGAFTGAVSQKIGKFEMANNGTLFLDEVAEFSYSLQAKLLRVLQERELTRVGGTTTIPLNFRLIVATHKNLQQEVEANQFREDLYYRMHGIVIHLSPLKERGNDILILAKHFAQEFCKENKIPIKKIGKTAARRLLDYAFPGNVRELKTIVDLACALSDSEVIEASDLQIDTRKSSVLEQNMEKPLEEQNIIIVKNLLQKYNNNIQKVAGILQIGRSTIYRMLEKDKKNKR